MARVSVRLGRRLPLKGPISSNTLLGEGEPRAGQVQAAEPVAEAVSVVSADPRRPRRPERLEVVPAVLRHRPLPRAVRVLVALIRGRRDRVLSLAAQAVRVVSWARVTVLPVGHLCTAAGPVDRDRVAGHQVNSAGKVDLGGLT